MQILITVALAAVAAIQTPSLAARLTRSEPVLVRAVIDGDTIDVATVGRVRLLGIDAPEIGRGFDTSAPFGREARERLTQLVLHRWVRLEQEGATLDVYNRHLAYVMTEDGLFVNAVLVREGLARVSARAAADAAARAAAGGGRGPERFAAACGAARRRFRRRVILERSKASRPPTSRSKTPASKRRKTRTKKP